MIVVIIYSADVRTTDRVYFDVHNLKDQLRFESVLASVNHNYDDWSHA